MTSILDFQPEPREASNKRAKSIVAAVYDFDSRAGGYIADVATKEELEQRLVVAGEDVSEVAGDHGLEPELLAAALTKRWEDEQTAEAERVEAKAAKVRRLARRKTADTEIPTGDDIELTDGRLVYVDRVEDGMVVFEDYDERDSDTYWNSRMPVENFKKLLPKEAGGSPKVEKQSVEWFHPDPDGMAEEVEGRNEQDVAEMLLSVLYEANEFDLTGVTTFENEGVLTGNEGVVLRFADGSEFQVSIVQSR